MCPTKLKVLLSTAPDEKVAETICRTLVEESLVACAQALPGLKSFYRWEGEPQSSNELLIILKTASPEATLARLRELHPYETPEGIVLAAEGGLADYLDWAEENSSP